MSCTVRIAETSDLDGLEELLVATGWETEAAGIRQDHAPYVVYVALDREGGIVGMLEGRFDSCYSDDFAPHALTYPQAWITLMTVDERSRRAGIGRTLLRRFSHDARTLYHRDYVALAVEQGEGESGRVAFFNRCGLRTIHVEEEVQRVMGAPLSEVLLDHPPAVSS